MTAKILVVDDEPDTLELIGFNLKKAGFDVSTAASGSEAVRKAKLVSPALIVLDVMLPELDGLEVCRQLRRDTQTAGIPIIMLTAKAAEIDRVLGLELGADDYVTKPFSPRELVLRIRNILGRREEALSTKEFLKLGEISLNLAAHQASVRGKPIELTATEFRLLTLLAQRRGRVQSRDQLLRDVWEYDAVIDTRTVDTHIRRLREKLGAAARHLETVRGVGYRLVD